MASYNDERDRLERKLCRLLILAREAAGLNQTQLGKAVIFGDTIPNSNRQIGIVSP